ncbi:MAG: hypothetical protein AB1540_06170 [Bdellovibrionota bacterium]
MRAIRAMKRLERVAATLAAAGVLLVFGMGSTCPGTSNSASFTNNRIQVTPVIATKSWRSPALIDLSASNEASAVLGAKYNNVSNVAGDGSTYPMAAAVAGNGSFHALFNREDSANNFINLYAIQQTDVTSSTWVQGLGSFTQLDAGLAATAESHHPLAVTDGSGNVLSVAMTFAAAGNRIPYASIYNINNGYWGTYTAIGSAAIGASGLGSLAAAVDANNNKVVVWQQNSEAYFNEYRPNLGWRFTTSWADADFEIAGDVVLDRGVDIGFDGYGNGYAAYVTNTPAIRTVRWRSDNVVRFSTAGDTASSGTTGGGPYGYPKIFVAQNGEAVVFFYNDLVGTGAELWCSSAAATSSSTAVAFSTATQFGTSYGTGDVYALDLGGNVIPPVLASSGDQAVLGFIKSDGVARRFYLFKYRSRCDWDYLGAIDSGGAGNDVYFGSLAINDDGTIAAVWSAASGGVERVYGNVYEGGVWKGVTLLDGGTNFQPTTLAGATPPDGLTRPKVVIDGSGNALALYSYNVQNTTIALTRRRAAAIFYR